MRAAVANNKLDIGHILHRIIKQLIDIIILLTDNTNMSSKKQEVDAVDLVRGHLLLQLKTEAILLIKTTDHPDSTIEKTLTDLIQTKIYQLY